MERILVKPAIPRSTADGVVRSARRLSTGGYVVLGLLLDEPASGWDLARKIDRSIAHFWPLTKAHIYAELPKIAARNWASAEAIAQSGAPDRRVFTATAAGRQAFRDWIAEVNLTDERGRQPLQLQLFFAAHADPAKLGELLNTWEARALDTEQHCADILGKRGIDTTQLRRLTLDGSPDTPSVYGKPRNSGALRGLDARGMTALFGLRRAQADLAWLQEVRTVLIEADFRRTQRPE